MDYATHIEAVERETSAFTRALMRAEADAQVPTCPDWTVRDLAKHVGGVLGFWSHVLADGTGRPKPQFDDEPGPAAGLWVVQVAGLLINELKAANADTEVYTWNPNDHSAGFVARRMAHETAVHRFDAQTAIGKPQAIDSALAADGIEEIFVMVDAWPKSGRGDGQTLHLHSAEGNEWLVAMNPDGLDVRREHAKGDLALRGAVSDLELLLYDRPPIGEVERLGDESVLDAWYRVFKFG
ncbi:MAG TPA: maleylpyruvate isomerase family mycothiol-dependent enzyme [Acidimicrobiales bacterium]|nr:maleylpyruvate isomerase family mycothiol-dependent enzyme [Acidimicrobiales bacterium]